MHIVLVAGRGCVLLGFGFNVFRRIKKTIETTITTTVTPTMMNIREKEVGNGDVVEPKA